MAFSDPQSVTVNSVPVSLPRTGMDATVGTFAKDDGSFGLRISQLKGARRDRQSVRLVNTKIVPDSINPNLNREVSMSVTLTADSPSQKQGGGYTLQQKKDLVDALLAYLTASSGARVAQLLGGEI